MHTASRYRRSLAFIWSPRLPVIYGGWKTAKARAGRFAISLNQPFRRYEISSTGLRIKYFQANAIQETIYLTRTSELGGAATRYAPWYGRGLLQLTWKENYIRYEKFISYAEGTTVLMDSVENNLALACDSAGFYWVSCAKEPDHAMNISREANSLPIFTDKSLSNICDAYDYRTRTCRGPLSTINFKISYQLERVARAVNTGSPISSGKVNGLVQRGYVFLTAMQALTDVLFDDQAASRQRE